MPVIGVCPRCCQQGLALMDILVDSNVILDILTEEPEWFSRSAEALSACAEK